MDIKVPFLSRTEKEMKNKDAENVLTGWVDACRIVEKKCLLIVGWAYHPGIEAVDFQLISVAEKEEGKANKEVLRIYEMRSTRQDVTQHFSHDGEEQWGFCILVEWPYDYPPEEKNLQLTVGFSDAKKQLALKPFVEPVGETLFEICAPWNFREKANFVRQLYRIVGVKLYEIPGFKNMEENKLRGLFNWNWENVLVIPGKGVFLSGWLLDGQHNLASMVLRTAGGSYSANLLENSVRFMRNDVLEAFPAAVSRDYKAGLYAWVPMPAITDNTGIELVALTYDGIKGVISLHKENVQNDITLASKKILASFDIKDRNYRDIMWHHIGAALSSLWHYRRTMIADPELDVIQFGQVVENPKRSVIVPIYGRYDFLLHQVAQFVSDPDFDETELIYVLDDPRLYDAFIPFCKDTSELFPVSFKVVYCGYNLGYAGANNIGARIASGPKLVLLNSDVIPSEPGWISRIENKASGLENVGVVAPKLVFDDGTIQHIGITFVKNPEFGNLWMNEHPGKGNPEWLVNIPEISEHPAVTGACMFIEKSLYDSVGGLDEDFIFGDFEDSDLCLKLMKSGRRHYLVGTEKLYHLERQSQGLFDNQDWKFKITLYNAWQHTERWGSLIENLVK